MHVEQLEVDPRLHMVMAGNCKKDIIQVMHQTMTNSYLPSPFIRSKTAESESRPIYITGRKSYVDDAVRKLQSLSHLRVSSRTCHLLYKINFLSNKI